MTNKPHQNKIIEKLPDYFLSAPQGRGKKKQNDNRLYYLWKKVNEIIVLLNGLDKDKTNDILIEVGRMIEKRTGK